MLDELELANILGVNLFYTTVPVVKEKVCVKESKTEFLQKDDTAVHFSIKYVNRIKITADDTWVLNY